MVICRDIKDDVNMVFPCPWKQRKRQETIYFLADFGDEHLSGASSGRSRRLPNNNATSCEVRRIPPPAGARGIPSRGIDKRKIHGKKQRLF
jgi:hypothetical protein